jgi:hypothetical protein
MGFLTEVSPDKSNRSEMCAIPMEAATKSIRLLTSWSRTSVPKILKAFPGVAYAKKKASFSLSVVPKLYLDVTHERRSLLTSELERSRPCGGRCA